jgi:hypothetical protein
MVQMDKRETIEARGAVVRRLRNGMAVAVPAVGLAVALLGAAPAAPALAQQKSGGTIDIGANIASTVANAVSGIATNSGPTTVIGGVQTTTNNQSLGGQEGLSVADSSGGDHNISSPTGGGGK